MENRIIFDKHCYKVYSNKEPFTLSKSINILIMQKSIPTAGTQDWAQPLNLHLSQLNNPTTGGINTIENYSGRPTSLGTDDIGYSTFNKETGNLHQWNGTAWKVLNNEIINIKDYGAILDGVTDDTAVLVAVAALDKDVIIPEGTLLLKGVIPSIKARIKGRGSKTIIKIANITSAPATGSSLISFADNGSLEDITFNLEQYSGTVEWFINIESKKNNKIINNSFLGSGAQTSLSHVIRADNSVNPIIEGNVFTNFQLEVIRAANSQKGKFNKNIFKNIQVDIRNPSRCILLGNARDYVIAENIFEDCGNVNPVLIDSQAPACIDVGSAVRGMIINNHAINVHTFLDMESYQDEDFFALVVEGNRIEGLRKITPTAPGYGFWINAPTTIREIILANNVVNYFDIGIVNTIGQDIKIIGNFISNCRQGIDMPSAFNFSIVGNTIRRCTNGLVVSGNAGYMGGVISGNQFLEISGNALSGTMNGYSVVGDEVVVSGNHFKSGEITYSHSWYFKESGNSRPYQRLSGSTVKFFGSDHAYTGNATPTTIVNIDVSPGSVKTLVCNDDNTTIDFTSGKLRGNGNVSQLLKRGDALLLTRVYEDDAINIVNVIIIPR
jgi:hypothetical protein